MPFRSLQSLFQPLNLRIEAVEQSQIRPANAITFLVIRFGLMSGMVLGFSWFALNLIP